MAGQAPREVSSIIYAIRNLLSQRKLVNHLRFEQNVAPRTQPPPNLPGGVSHNLAENYYYTRDGRRYVTRPQEIYNEGVKAVTSGKADTAQMGQKILNVRPGFGYNPETNSPLYKKQ